MILISGKNSLKEALLSNSKLDRIIVSQSVQHQHDIASILSSANAQNVKIQVLSPQKFQDLIDEPHSGGIAGYLTDIQFMPLKTLEKSPHDYPFLVIVDHIEDPFNFGGILRTANYFGVDAVVYPKDRNSQLSPGVIRASSGAATHLNLVRVSNIGGSIKQLQKAGYWVYGTDVESGESLDSFVPAAPCALVIGNEHKGVSKRVQEMVDLNLNIRSFGQVESLNVSVATGIIVHHLSEKLKHASTAKQV